MSLQKNITELNARFVDLLIARWERVLDLRTHLAYRRGDEDDQGQIAAYEAEIRRLLAAIDECREEAKKLQQVLPFDRLTQSYNLSSLEAEILELAMVPHMELSFRQRIARFNNNILYDFVDVDLALTLLFPTRVERLQARALFSANAPLISHGLVRLEKAKEAKGSGVLGQELRPPDRLSDFVLGRRSLDASLRSVAEMSDPNAELDEVAIPEESRTELTSFLTFFEKSQGGARVGVGGPFPEGGGMAISFVGAPGTGKSMLSEAIGATLKRPLIVVDSGRLTGDADKAHLLTQKLFDEARVQGAVLVFDRCEPLFAKGNARLPVLYSLMDRFGGLVILTLSNTDELDPGLERHITWQLTLEIPEVEQRTMIWKNHLPSSVALAEDVDVEDLGTRFEITGGQIRNACILAETRALAMKDDKAVIDLAMMKSAAYAQLRADMTEYAVRSKVNLTLDDLVLPEEELGLVREVLEACQNRVYVMSKWGFGKRLVTGKGICCLLKGEPGTGKTLCAEILAAELGMKLYQISIPKIVSKFIGETEKNIAKIFSTARANHSMLLFDEADSLFTKRVSVENAIDRFSNMETNMLLQEIERFEGIVILTTNLDKNIDDAFSRRIQFKIDFPFPTPENRAIIWRALVPKECPIADDIDFDDLGENFELSGGYIKNAVVRAAYRAAARQGEITYDDIEFAAEQECKSAGKLFRSASAQDDW